MHSKGSTAARANETTARITNWRVDTDGILRVTAHILKEGVYPYSKEEMATHGESAFCFSGINPVMQFIPAEEFTEEAFCSLEGKPIVINAHEWRDVNNTLVDGLTIGTVAGRPRAGAHGTLECDMLIFDPETIERIKKHELVEVSSGYDARLDGESGDYHGTAYHTAQRDLRFNHVLLLPPGRGRCGYDVRIINQKPKQQDGKNMPKTVKFTNEKGEEKSFHFESAQDAATAEAMLKENSNKADTKKAEDGANENRMAQLTRKLEKCEAELEKAQAEIERLNAPETKENLAREALKQREDEKKILSNAAPEDMDTFINSLLNKSDLERRRAIVKHVIASRGLPAREIGDEEAHALFSFFADEATLMQKTQSSGQSNCQCSSPSGTADAPSRLLNEKRLAASAMSARERMLMPMRS